MGWTYTPDRKGVAQYLKFDKQLNMELHRRALLGLSLAVALAPRRTGKLAASGRVVDDGPNAGVNHDRMGYSVVFNVPYAVPATYPKRDPTARDYLIAALAVMSRGG